MRDEYDFSDAVKNPFAGKKEKGKFSVTVHYSPEDISNGNFDDTKDIICAILSKMTDNDAKRLLLHIKDNFSLPYSDDFWGTVLPNPAAPDYAAISPLKGEHTQSAEPCVAENSLEYKK